MGTYSDRRDAVLYSQAGSAVGGSAPTETEVVTIAAPDESVTETTGGILGGPAPAGTGVNIVTPGTVIVQPSGAGELSTNVFNSTTTNVPTGFTPVLAGGIFTPETGFAETNNAGTVQPGVTNALTGGAISTTNEVPLSAVNTNGFVQTSNTFTPFTLTNGPAVGSTSTNRQFGQTNMNEAAGAQRTNSSGGATSTNYPPNSVAARQAQAQRAVDAAALHQQQAVQGTLNAQPQTQQQNGASATTSGNQQGGTTQPTGTTQQSGTVQQTGTAQQNSGNINAQTSGDSGVVSPQPAMQPNQQRQLLPAQPAPAPAPAPAR